MNEYFKTNYKTILESANTKAGRFLLDIKEKEPIVKVTPNAYIFKKGSQYKGIFYTNDKIANTFLPIITKLNIAKDEYRTKVEEDEYKAFLHYAELEKARYLPQIYLTDFTSNAGGDGGINAANATWSTARNAGTGNFTFTDTGVGWDGTNGFYIRRSFYPFDTSAITVGATITEALLKIYVTLVLDSYNDAYSYINIFQSTQADETSLVLGDFDEIGSTAGATAIDLTAGFTTSAYNTFTLDATGRGWVTPGGWSKLASREGHDAENQEPGSSGAPNSIIRQQFSEDANDPTLSVTWSVAGGGAFLAIL